MSGVVCVRRKIFRLSMLPQEPARFSVRQTWTPQLLMKSWCLYVILSIRACRSTPLGVTHVCTVSVVRTFCCDSGPRPRHHFPAATIIMKQPQRKSQRLDLVSMLVCEANPSALLRPPRVRVHPSMHAHVPLDKFCSFCALWAPVSRSNDSTSRRRRASHMDTGLGRRPLDATHGCSLERLQ